MVSGSPSVTQPGPGGIRAGPSLLTPDGLWRGGCPPAGGGSEEAGAGDLPSALLCLLLKERPGQQGGVFFMNDKAGAH